MAHHAYYVAGDLDEGIAAARSYGEKELGLTGNAHSDIVTLRYHLFPVEEARLVSEIASRAPTQGDARLIILAAGRIFHETQNALLKVFEEPAPGTYIVLVVPSEGNIIPTLRSRLLPLPGTSSSNVLSPLAEEFVSAGKEGREKVVEKILERAKKDSPEEKQAARIDALRLAEGLLVAAHKSMDQAFLSDLMHFIPILHERSAPLKPILEHLLIVTPSSIEEHPRG